MYNYEKNREQVVNDLDRVIKLIHMKADEIPAEEKAQMVKETVEHFNTYVSPAGSITESASPPRPKAAPFWNGKTAAPTSAAYMTTRSFWMPWVASASMWPATAKTSSSTP